MEENTTQTHTAEKTTAPKSSAPRKSFASRRPMGGSGKGGMQRTGGPRRRREEGQKPRSEFDQKTLEVRRVTRVVSGGRRFAFSVAVVSGNKNGLVGVGIGKAGDTALAIQKALADAKRNMISLALTDKKSIATQTEAKNSSGRIMMFPNAGRGLVAGSAVRVVLELAGIKDVTAKVISPSKNKLNIARTTIDALRVFAKKSAPVVEAEAKEEKPVTQ